MPNNIYPIPSLNIESVRIQIGMMDMAKRNRGKILNKLPSKGRGECPLCGKTRIKLLYPHRTDTNQLINVCKNCRNK